MTATDVLKYIKTKMNEYHTYCVTALIRYEFTDEMKVIIFCASDILRENIFAIISSSGIPDLDLCSSHASEVDGEFSIISVKDIVDTEF